ncbi:MAG: acyltransferase [Flavobacterium sp.]
MSTSKNRLRELDFLRGIAIVLVLLRHQYLFQFTKNMGWIGVDLFFVLSGFLVSGLLFKEYLKYGNIKPKLFLIRRGFKIYPIYFIFYLLYLIPILIKHKLEWVGLLSDVFFVQNYVLGWGYAYAASWSLAVEEHFYFGFALLLYWALKKKWIYVKKESHKISGLGLLIVAIMILCFGLRLVSNIYFPNDNVRNFTMTHLRVDSLLAGVFVSYLYYFRTEFLTHFFNSYKKILLLLALLLVSFSPIIDPMDSFYIRTFGFTFLYIGFGIVLVYFLIDKNINKTLNKCFSNTMVNTISKIGFSSYSIYIIHTFVNYFYRLANSLIFHESLHQNFIFIASSLSSIVIGIAMTTYIEKYFLNIRDRRYPSRIS